MSLRIGFRFDGKCSLHPRYNPETDGRPQNASCQGCDGLYVIHLYTHIARKKAGKADGLIVRQSRAILRATPSSATRKKRYPARQIIQRLNDREALPVHFMLVIAWLHVVYA